MTDESRRAPRVFWTRRAALRYAVEENPYPFGTREGAEWLRDYWGDQAARGMRRLALMQVLATILAAIALASTVLQVILR